MMDKEISKNKNPTYTTRVITSANSSIPRSKETKVPSQTFIHWDHNASKTLINERQSNKSNSCFCFLMFAIVMVFVISFAGPWYSDCGNRDCSRQRYYGLYCEDYCWYGHYGPGTGTGGAGILLVLVFVFLWIYSLHCGTADSNRIR